MEKRLEGISYENSIISVPGFTEKNLHVADQLSMKKHLFFRKNSLYRKYYISKVSINSTYFI